MRRLIVIMQIVQKQSGRIHLGKSTSMLKIKLNFFSDIKIFRYENV